MEHAKSISIPWCAKQLTFSNVEKIRVQYQLEKELTSRFGEDFSDSVCTVEKLLGKQSSLREYDNKVLVGTLTSSPNYCSAEKKDFTLLWQDGTGDIPCIILPDIKLQDFECVSVVSCWRLRFNGSPYLEINGPMKAIVAKKKIAVSLQNAISIKDACTLLLKKEVVKFQNTVSLMGRVVALSEIFLVKSEFLFVIQLTEYSGSMVNILVKGFSYLKWQKLLKVGCQYVFYELRPTTIFKDRREEHKIFLTWNSSSFLPFEDFSGEILPLKDWLLMYFSKTINDDLENVEKDAYCFDGDMIHINFEGEITDMSDSDIAIYILNNCVKLYLLCVPSVFCHLHTKTTYIFYNVWPKYNEKGDIVALFGCVHTSIQQLTFSPLDSSVQCISLECKAILSLVAQYGLDHPQLIWLESLKNSIAHRFPHHCTSLSKMLAILKILKKMYMDDVMERNWVFEFISPNGQCKSHVSFKALNFADVKTVELRASLNPSQSELAWDISNINPNTDNEALIAELRSNVNTGEIMLSDITGSIDAIITLNSQESTKADYLADYHVSDACCIECCNSCNSLPQPWLNGHLIFIDKYQIIIEEYRLTQDSLPIQKLYIQFMLNDAVFLNAVPVYKKHLPNCSVKIACQICSVTDLPVCSNEYVDATDDKCCKLFSPCQDKGYNSSLCNKKSRTHDPSQLVVFIQKGLLHFNQETDKLQFSTTALIVMPKSGNDLREDSLTLLFCGENIKFHSTLHIGFMYMCYFKIKKEKIMTVPDNAQFCPVTKLDSTCFKCYQGLSSCYHVGDQMISANTVPICEVRACKEDDQISINAIIMKKKVLPDSKSSFYAAGALKLKNEVHVLHHVAICLTLKDQETDEQICMYIPLQYNIPLLGIIPGCVIEARDVYLRQSNRKSMERYLQFHKHSSLILKQFPITIKKSIESIKAKVVFNKSSTNYRNLCDVWKPNFGSDPFICYVHVQQVLRMFIGESICQNCLRRGVHNETKCMTAGCSGETTLVSQVSLSVDDGTATTRVLCNDAQKFLGFNSGEFDELKIVIAEHGFFSFGMESVTSNPNPSSGHKVLQYLHRLCSGTKLQRSLLMLLKLDSINKKEFADSKRKSVRVEGGNIETTLLPIITLRCIDILSIDHEQFSLSMNMTNITQ